MFNLKVIIGAVVIAALMYGGVIDLKVYPAELPKVPARLMALVEGEDFLAQGQEYVTNIFSSKKSGNKEVADKNEANGEVAGAKDDKEEKAVEKEEPKASFKGITFPLKF